MSTTRSVTPKAPATDPGGKHGLLICAHGGRGGAGSALRHAARIRRGGGFAEVRVCRLNGRPEAAEVAARMRGERVFVVPLLMADGYTAARLMRRLVTAAPGSRRKIVPCAPVGCHPGIAGLIARAARNRCRERGWVAADSVVVLAGHGTARDPNSRRTALAHAARLAASGGFAEVAAAFLDERPRVAEVLDAFGGRPRVVVGLFADRGVHGEDDMRRLIRRADGPVAYAGPIGTMREIAELIVQQVEAERTLAFAV